MEEEGDEDGEGCRPTGVLSAKHARYFITWIKCLNTRHVRNSSTTAQSPPWGVKKRRGGRGRRGVGWEGRGREGRGELYLRPS